MNVTVSAAWQAATRRGLTRLEAQRLLAHVLGLPAERARAWLLAHDADPVAPADLQAFESLVQRHLDGEPMGYLVGIQEFHGLPFEVGPGVLVPRPDTETLVDWALDCLQGRGDARVADLGTGSGAIALALAARHPGLQVTAVDISEAALDTARRNAQRLGLAVSFRHGCWWQALAPSEGPFDLVVSNPPYIAEGDPHLTALRHEPLAALVSGTDGLDAIRLILAGAPDWLRPDGWLLFEHGHDQPAAVAALMARAGWREVTHRRDLAGHLRCTGGRRPAV